MFSGMSQRMRKPRLDKQQEFCCCLKLFSSDVSVAQCCHFICQVKVAKLPIVPLPLPSLLLTDCPDFEGSAQLGKVMSYSTDVQKENTWLKFISGSSILDFLK